MEKYSRLSKITNQYLHGNLNKVNLRYEKDNSLILSIEYEDTNHYWFDYEMNFSIPKATIENASHFSEGSLNKISLNRETAFEKAVYNYLFDKESRLN